MKTEPVFPKAELALFQAVLTGPACPSHWQLCQVPPYTALAKVDEGA